MKSFLRNLSPERTFVWLAAIFGTVFIFITPPFQTPDENRHYYRAYQVSEGTLFAVKTDQRLGGYLPEEVRDCVLPFLELRGAEELKMNADTLWNGIFWQGSEKRVFVDFPASAAYTPVSYIPSAIGIALGRLFDAPPIVGLYVARLMTLLCWILALFLAIRITPVFKWLFVALALLPMSIFINGSLNADMMTNALAFLFIAFVFKQAFSDEKQTTREFGVLVLLIVLLASAKLLYAPLVLLFLLIPLKNYASKMQFFLRFGGISLLALGTMILWTKVQGNTYIPYNEYNLEYRDYVNLMACSTVAEQMQYALENGTYIFELFGNSLTKFFSRYTEGYIGNFGWLEVPLPRALSIVMYAFLFFVTFSQETTFRLRISQRLIFVGTGLLVFLLIVFSQYLIWNCKGDALITNLQGRYFIPIFPLFFFAMAWNKERFLKWVPTTVITFSFAALLISKVVIYKRFYVPNTYVVETALCDHETVQDDWNFRTSNPKYLATNAFSRSSEMAYSGKYSSRINDSIQYGTLITFDGCKYGDIIYAEAWIYGTALIVISDSSAKKLYHTESSGVNKHSWRKVTLEVRTSTEIDNERISCYLFRPKGSGVAYADNFKVRIRRRVF